MKVWLTGGAGFVGDYLTELPVEDRPVVALAVNDERRKPWRIQSVLHELEVDLSNHVHDAKVPTPEDEGNHGALEA